MEEKRIELGPLEKNGEKLLRSVDAGNMCAVLSGGEIMYLFLRGDAYRTVLHAIGAEEGRQRAWERSERNRAMLKNLDAAADQFFEIRFDPEMDLMGVMAAAERGICNFLRSVGAPPGEDIDFMEGLEEKEGGSA